MEARQIVNLLAPGQYRLGPPNCGLRLMVSGVTVNHLLTGSIPVPTAYYGRMECFDVPCSMRVKFPDRLKVGPQPLKLFVVVRSHLREQWSCGEMASRLPLEQVF